MCNIVKLAIKTECGRAVALVHFCVICTTLRMGTVKSELGNERVVRVGIFVANCYSKNGVSPGEINLV